MNALNRQLSLLCLISVACIILIKDYIRPKHIHFSNLGIYLQGTLPNFFAATGIFSLLLMLGMLFSENKNLTPLLLLSASVTFFGLLFWEFVRFYFGHMNFDWNDILMTFLGTMLILLYSYRTIVINQY